MADSRGPLKPSTPPRVALFVTCLADAIRPSVGFATLKLLQDAGCQVEVPAHRAELPRRERRDLRPAGASPRGSPAACPPS